MTQLLQVKRIDNEGEKVAEISIYDVIGRDFWDDDEPTTAKHIADVLKSYGKLDRIVVRINSPGGSLWDALPIYNLLKDHPARVIVHIDGMAFSAASVVAMAGDEIHAAENALMMIHRPSTHTDGTSDDLRADADMLDKYETQIVDIYAARTGQPADEVRRSVRAETWYTAKEAKSAGYITHVTPNKSVAAYHGPLPENVKIPARFVPLFTKEPENVSKPETPVAETPKPETPEPENKQPETPVETPVETLKPETPEPENKQPETPKPVDASRFNLIANACKTYGGNVDDVIHLVNSGLSILDVQQYFINAKAATAAPVGDGKGQEPATPDAKFKAEFAANRKVYDNMGVSEEEYVASRMNDPE